MPSERIELFAAAVKEAFNESTGPMGLRSMTEISAFPSDISVRAPGGRPEQTLAGGRTLYVWYHKGLHLPHRSLAEFGIRVDLNEIDFQTPQKSGLSQ